MAGRSVTVRYPGGTLTLVEGQGTSLITVTANNDKSRFEIDVTPEANKVFRYFVESDGSHSSSLYWYYTNPSNTLTAVCMSSSSYTHKIKSSNKSKGTASSTATVSIWEDGSKRSGSDAVATASPKSGCVFTGWSGDTSQAVFSGDGNRTCTIPATVSANVTVTANFARMYTVAFDVHGGTGVSSQTVLEGSSIQTSPSTTRTGYMFAGWFDSATGGNKYSFPLTVTSDMTLHAQWTAKTYTVSLNQQSGSGGTTQVTATYGLAMPAATMPTRTGYTFGGYYTGTNGAGTQYYTASGASARSWTIDSGGTLYAKWTETAYEFSVHPNGGVYNGSTGAVRVSPNSGGTYLTTGRSSFSAIGRATRGGYTLAGYWDASNATGGNQAYDADGRAVDGAYWNGSGTSATFKGLSSGTSLTVYARWEPSSYTLTCNPNGGTLSGGNFGAKNGTAQTASVTVTYGKSSYANLGRAARDGYTFTGWWTAASGGTRVFDSNGNWVIGQYWNSSKQWIYTGDVALYAQWTVKTYTVNLDLAGGTGPVSSVMATYGRMLPDLGASNVPTRSGYLFDGFYSGADGAGQRFYFSAGVANDTLTWQTDGGGTLYAKWSRRVNATMTSASTDNDGAFPQAVTTRPVVKIVVGGVTSRGETADAVAVEGGNVTIQAVETWRSRDGAEKGMTFSHFVVTIGSQVVVDRKSAVSSSGSWKECSFVVPRGNPTDAEIVAVAYYERDVLVVSAGIDSFALGKGLSQSLASVTFADGSTISASSPARFGDELAFAAADTAGHSFFGWSEYYDSQQGVVSNSKRYVTVANGDLSLYARYAVRSRVLVDALDASGEPTAGGGTVAVSVFGTPVQNPSDAFLVPIGAAMQLSSTANQGFFFSCVLFAPEGGVGDPTSHGGNDEISPDDSGTYTVVFRASPPYVYLACADVAEQGVSGVAGSTTATYNGHDADAFFEVDQTEAAAVLDVSGVPSGARWYKVRQGTTVMLVATRSSASQGTILERKEYADVGIDRLAEQYVLKVNPNGGAHGGSSSEHQVSPDGQGRYLTLNKSTFWAIGAPTRSGYQPTGLYDSPTGGNKVYDADGHAVDGAYWNGSGSTARFKGVPSSNTLTVYAQWTENGELGGQASLLGATPEPLDDDAPNMSEWTDRAYSVSGDRLITTTWGLFANPKVTLKPQPGGRAVFVGVDPVGGEDVHEKSFPVSGGTYQTATVRAIPDPSGGYNFSGWTRDGVVVAKTADYVFEVRADCTLVAMFTLDDNAVFAWEGGRRNKRMTWTSGVLTAPRPEDPVAVRVDAEKYPVLVEVRTHSSPEADGYTRVHQVSVGSQVARRLPRMKAERYWQVSVESTEEVDAVIVATNIVEAN